MAQTRRFHGLVLDYGQCALMYFRLNALHESSWRYLTRNLLAIPGEDKDQRKRAALEML